MYMYLDWSANYGHIVNFLSTVKGNAAGSVGGDKVIGPGPPSDFQQLNLRFDTEDHLPNLRLSDASEGKQSEQWC